MMIVPIAAAVAANNAAATAIRNGEKLPHWLLCFQLTVYGLVLLCLLAMVGGMVWDSITWRKR